MISLLIRKTRKARGARGLGKPTARRYRVARLLVLAVLVLGGLLAACSDPPRRLGPGETYRRKRDLVLRHQHELTARQRHDFMYRHVLGATQSDLEETMREEVEAYHRQERRENALLEEKRRRSSEVLAEERSDEGDRDQEEGALDLDRLSEVLRGPSFGGEEDREE